jgi:hypothetical protein
MSTTTDITGNEFRSKFTDYYEKKSLLLKAISDKTVQLEKTYNNVQITEEYGIQVFDNSATPLERVRMGNYASGKYGLRITNSNGTTVILDQDGFLQSWGDSQADNVDATHKLLLKFYVPDEALSVKKLKLNFALQKYRAYETSAASGGSSSETSGSGGSSNPTSSSGGSDNVTSGSSSASTTGAGSGTAVSGNTSIESGHQHTYLTYVPSDHTHGMDHTHSVSISNHTHSVSIGNHTHSVSIPAHTHGLVYGIYESTVATGVKVYVDGVLCLDNGGSGYTTDQDNLDLTQWIATSGWHSIELSSTQLGRINAAYFIQVFLGV